MNKSNTTLPRTLTEVFMTESPTTTVEEHDAGVLALQKWLMTDSVLKTLRGARTCTVESLPSSNPRIASLHILCPAGKPIDTRRVKERIGNIISEQYGKLIDGGDVNVWYSLGEGVHAIIHIVRLNPNRKPAR